VILTARENDPAQAQQGLEELCRTYWYPLYSYLRRRGYQPADAEDLVQGLITKLLQRDFLKNVTPEKGRFRSFLLTCLKHHVADLHQESLAHKRGGGQKTISLDQLTSEQRFLTEGPSHADPEHLFERQWALSTIESALRRLKEETAPHGNQELFDVLCGYLAREKRDPTYAEVARRFGLNETAVRSSVYRMRRQYRKLFREEIAKTVGYANELEDEIRHLLAVLG